eukprot:1157407-Pelagomonas_calceolata.AAC.5
MHGRTIALIKTWFVPCWTLPGLGLPGTVQYGARQDKTMPGTKQDRTRLCQPRPRALRTAPGMALLGTVQHGSRQDKATPATKQDHARHCLAWHNTGHGYASHKARALRIGKNHTNITCLPFFLPLLLYKKSSRLCCCLWRI